MLVIQNSDKLIEFLIKINVLGLSLGYAKGDNPLVRFNLGVIQKPTTRLFVEALEHELPYVNLCFRLNDYLITLVIDRTASSD